MGGGSCSLLSSTVPGPMDAPGTFCDGQVLGSHRLAGAERGWARSKDWTGVETWPVADLEV
jgi:hypothetical protein